MNIIKICGIAALVVAAIFVLSACKKSTFVSVDAARFAEEITRKGVQIVDVRTAAEFADGHIPGAVNIDVNSPDFAQQIAKLNTSKTIALYCRSGRRSKIAAEKVTAAGYKVVELDGGILSWRGEVVR